MQTKSSKSDLSFESRVLSPSIGLEIFGLKLDYPLQKGVLGELKDALLQYHVLVIRDQKLTPGQQIEFAQQMGEPDIYPFVQGIESYPFITPIIKEAHETQNFGGIWHTDTAYLKRPPSATILLARETPPEGGDTIFSSQISAYESLSNGMKALLASLRGFNTSEKVNRVRTNVSEKRKRETLTAVHPVIRTHPETRKKALYVNFGHTIYFEGMTTKESEPLLEFLFQYQIQEDFTCRVRWFPGTLVIWDNRSTQHLPLNDYQGYRREMHRIILKGDIPV